MQEVRQYEITLENGERKILNDADLRKGTQVFYSELGPGFGMEGIINIRPLPNKRILDAGGIRAPKPD